MVVYRGGMAAVSRVHLPPPSRGRMTATTRMLVDSAPCPACPMSFELSVASSSDLSVVRFGPGDGLPIAAANDSEGCGGSSDSHAPSASPEKPAVRGGSFLSSHVLNLLMEV